PHQGVAPPPARRLRHRPRRPHRLRRLRRRPDAGARLRSGDRGGAGGGNWRITNVPKSGASEHAETDEDHGKVVAECSEQHGEPEWAGKPLSPERVALSIEGIQWAAGSWAGIVDTEAFKAYIRERRRSSSRPPVKLDTERWPMVSDRFRRTDA